MTSTLESLDTTLEEAALRSAAYLRAIRDRSVSPEASAVRRLTDLAGPFPTSPESASAILELLDEVGSPATVASAAGRYFGFVTGGALPAAVAASWMASAWDQNAGAQVMSPVAASLERVALAWVMEALGLPPTCGGGLVTGATMANFTALAAARH